jgi:type IV pilus assembly protein PilW
MGADMNRKIRRSRTSVRDSGFTLIELLISMLLGLLVVGSVIGVLVSNKRSYGTNQGLSQVQESTRTAYELLARDLRQADGNGCGNVARTANVLTTPAVWWQNWFGMRAYDSTQVDPAVPFGTTVGRRVAGTDSIQVQSIEGNAMSVSLHNAAARRIEINVATSDFVVGDIMLICDFDHTAIFRATASVQSGTVSVTHDQFAGSPGNCSQGLGFPTVCTTTGNVYVYPRNAQIGRMITTSWYIGNNGRAAEGGRSLYRRRVGAGGVVATEEIVAGVTDMQLQFRAQGADAILADATLVPDWTLINSVLIGLTSQSGDTNVTTDNTVNNGRVERTYNYLISLRNRLQ